jgi:hypothetical protein
MYEDLIRVQGFVLGTGTTLLVFTNKVVPVPKTNPQSHSYHRLDLTSACLIAYSDVGGEKHSQLGYGITMQERLVLYHIPAFESRKSSRLFTGAFSGEPLALDHAFDIAFTLHHDYKNMLGISCLSTYEWTLWRYDTLSRGLRPRENINFQ